MGKSKKQAQNKIPGIEGLSSKTWGLCEGCHDDPEETQFGASENRQGSVNERYGSNLLYPGRGT